MEDYSVTIKIKVEIQAPTLSDALDVMLDTFGPGSINDANVVEYEVLDPVESE